MRVGWSVMPDAATSGGFGETAVRFRTKSHDLFGVITTPRGVPSRGIGVVLATGGSYIAAPNRNRLSVRIARQLAQLGFSVIRFDYRGVGESDGIILGYTIERPFVEDLEGAVRVLEEAGASRIIVVGSCFGARTLLAAVDRLPKLIGALLISTPVRDFPMGDNLPDRYTRELSLGQLAWKALRSRAWRNLVAPRSREAFLRTRLLYVRTARLAARRVLRWRRNGEARSQVSAPFRAGLTALLKRKIPVLLLYGRDENFYEEFERARAGELADLLASHRDTAVVETIEGVVHGFTSIEVQEQVLARTIAWVRATWARDDLVAAPALR